MTFPEPITRKHKDSKRAILLYIFHILFVVGLIFTIYCFRDLLVENHISQLLLGSFMGGFIVNLLIKHLDVIVGLRAEEEKIYNLINAFLFNIYMLTGPGDIYTPVKNGTTISQIKLENSEKLLDHASKIFKDENLLKKFNNLISSIVNYNNDVSKFNQISIGVLNKDD